MLKFVLSDTRAIILKLGPPPPGQGDFARMAVTYLSMKIFGQFCFLKTGI
jgi:hypothetical protein